MDIKHYLNTFWQQYQQEIPAVKRIYEAFLQRGEELSFLSHDHLALRTFNHPKVNIERMMAYFVELGYTPAQTYDFPVKKLFARHYEPPQEHMPKVFVSELLVEQCSRELQQTIEQMITQIPEAVLSEKGLLARSGVHWQPLNFASYEKLLAESEYAAWLYAYGFRANHFAIQVNRLQSFASCAEINAFLKQQGYTINAEQGEVKGSQEVLLEQSSIMAEKNHVNFSDGPHEIASCYYEFTHRFADDSGQLYPGFVPSSADKLFESTHQK